MPFNPLNNRFYKFNVLQLKIQIHKTNICTHSEIIGSHIYKLKEDTCMLIFIELNK